MKQLTAYNDCDSSIFSVRIARTEQNIELVQFIIILLIFNDCIIFIQLSIRSIPIKTDVVFQNTKTNYKRNSITHLTVNKIF